MSKSPKKSAPPVLSREVFYKGQKIVEQDSTAYRAYYIETGEVEISVREGKHEIPVSKLGPGEIFGEMGLLVGNQRYATATALSECTLTLISKDVLENKIGAIEDKAIRAIINVLITRLRESNIGQLHHYKNFADFQERLAGLLDKANQGIDKDKKDAFRDEAAPLLDQLESLLDKYHR